MVGKWDAVKGSGPTGLLPRLWRRPPGGGGRCLVDLVGRLTGKFGNPNPAIRDGNNLLENGFEFLQFRSCYTTIPATRCGGSLRWQAARCGIEDRASFQGGEVPASAGKPFFPQTATGGKTLATSRSFLRCLHGDGEGSLFSGGPAARWSFSPWQGDGRTAIWWRKAETRWRGAAVAGSARCWAPALLFGRWKTPTPGPGLSSRQHVGNTSK